MAMDIVGNIALWGVVAGLVVGLAMVFLSSRELRAGAEGQLLRFGVGGTLFMIAWAFASTARAAPHVEIGIGVIALGALVAGVVLSIARRIRGGA